jgi:putative hydrolase of the HAD superfamily
MQVVISSEIGWRKPATQFFEELVRRIERRPEEVIYVGDSFENDYQPAAALGMRACWLRRSGAAKAEERALASLDDLQTSLTMLLDRQPGSAFCTRGYESSD